MVIDATKRLEILFEYGSMVEFLTRFFMGTVVNYDSLYHTHQTMLEHQIEDQYIREEWEIRKEEFLDAGYTKSDIIYESKDEAINSISDSILDDMAHGLAARYFQSNQDMIPDLIKFIRKTISC